MWVTIPTSTQWCHDGRPAGHALAVRTADKNRPAFRQSGFERIQEGLIELSLVLTGSFGLLLTLQAGADVMLALLHFGDNALLGAAPLKTAQSALQRLVLLDANFRHGFPSLRWHPAQSRMRSGPYTRLDYYIHCFPNCQAGFLYFYKNQETMPLRQAHRERCPTRSGMVFLVSERRTVRITMSLRGGRSPTWQSVPLFTL